MERKFDFPEMKEIKEGIRKKYQRVAISPEGNFQYPTGRSGLEKQNYDPAVNLLFRRIRSYFLTKRESSF